MTQIPFYFLGRLIFILVCGCLLLTNNAALAQTPFQTEDYQLNGGGIVVEYDGIAAAGAPREDVNGMSDVGAVYIYEKDISGQWTQVQKILPPLPNASPNIIFSGQQAGARFGSSVAITDDNLIIGAPKWDLGTMQSAGVVYYYEKDTGGNWVIVDDLIGSSNDQIGRTLAASGEWLIFSSDNFPNASVSVYKRNQNGVYFFEIEFIGGPVAPTFNPTPGDYGYSIAVKDGAIPVIAVGQPNYDNGTNTGNGAVFMYRLVNNFWKWVPPQIIFEGNTLSSNRQTFFGGSVAISANTLGVPVVMIGDPWYQDVPNPAGGTFSTAGAVFPYWLDPILGYNNGGNVWTNLISPCILPCTSPMFTASNPEDQGRFGNSLDISGSKVLIGTGFAGDPANPPDRAYLADWSLAIPFTFFPTVAATGPASSLSFSEDVIFEPSDDTHPLHFSNRVALVDFNSVLVGTEPPPSSSSSLPPRLYSYDFELCNGIPVTVNMNYGKETTPQDDVVLGTPGDDDIRGKGGNDIICGMDGDDFIHGNSGDDYVNGGNGIDNLKGGAGADIIHTGSGATVGNSSRAFGGYGDDLIYGGSDADDLRGGRGNDIIQGKGGNDVINGNQDDDMIYGQAGDDDLKGGYGDNDELYGGTGSDSLNGGEGTNDLCNGGGESGDSEVNCE